MKVEIVNQLRRPIVRYHGGKWRLAPWIISHFPKHRIYVEPFGGGASVLLRKPRSYGEIYNDLDGEIVNVFRVMRDRGEELQRALHLTPFSRIEFLQSYQPHADTLEQARRTIIRAFQGFGSAAVCGERSGFRANSNRSGTTPAQDWKNYPDYVPAIIERLRGVVIEQRDAIEVMKQHDAQDVLHYVDPPYVHSSRSSKKRGTASGSSYKHEMSDEQHRTLAGELSGLIGMVLVSGYRTDLYDDLYRGWKRSEINCHADGARPRIEVLWMNESAWFQQSQSRLFA